MAEGRERERSPNPPSSQAYRYTTPARSNYRYSHDNDNDDDDIPPWNSGLQVPRPAYGYQGGTHEVPITITSPAC